MSTQSTKDEQARVLKDSPELAAEAQAMYEAMDALTPHQKHILIERVLSAVHKGTMYLSAEDDKQARLLNGFQLVGMLSLGGYTAAALIEDADEDSNSSKAVDTILERFEQTNRRNIARSLGLDPETAAIADGIADRIRERVERGEDEDEAFRIEVTASDLPEEEKEKTLRDAEEQGGWKAGLKAPAAKNDNEGAGYGLYL